MICAVSLRRKKLLELSKKSRAMAAPICADKKGFAESQLDDKERSGDLVEDVRTGRYVRGNPQEGDPGAGEMTHRIGKWVPPYRLAGTYHNHGITPAQDSNRRSFSTPATRPGDPINDYDTQRTLQFERNLDGPMLLQLGDSVKFLYFMAPDQPVEWEEACP